MKEFDLLILKNKKMKTKLGLGVLLAVLLFMFTKDPQRGASEGHGHHVAGNYQHMNKIKIVRIR